MLQVPEKTEKSRFTRPETYVSTTVRSGLGFSTVLFVLMFATGNCDMCSGTNRDYVGDAIDAMGE